MTDKFMQRIGVESIGRQISTERLDAPVAEIIGYLREKGVGISTPVDIQFKDEFAQVHMNAIYYAIVRRIDGELSYASVTKPLIGPN